MLNIRATTVINRCIVGGSSELCKAGQDSFFLDPTGPPAECIKADRLDGMCQWSQLSGCVGLDQGHRRPSSPIFTAVGDDGMSDSLTSRLIGWQYQTIIMKVAMISELAVAKLAVESSTTISLPLYAYIQQPTR